MDHGVLSACMAMQIFMQ